MRFQSFGECVESFPTCDATVRQSDFTDFSFDGHAQGHFPYVECFVPWLSGPLGECVWGVAFTAPGKGVVD